MPQAILSTTAPFGFEIDTLRFLEGFRAVGCTSCQFFRNQAKPPTPAEALRAVERAGMRFDSIHGVFGPDIDPSSPDAEERRRCVKLYEDEARLAVELGGPMVVVHPSRSAPPKSEPVPMPRAEARRVQEGRWPHLQDFLKRLAEVGERLGVTYLVENLMYDCPLGHNPAELAERVLEVKSARVRMCFDTGHAHATLSGFSAAGRAAVGITLRVCAPAIGYIHAHDNNGTKDAHLMPGRGGATGIDWDSFADAVHRTECGAIRMLEVFEDPGLSGPSADVRRSLARMLGATERED
jgi:sugar phosphate isomerase/epimerase